MHNNDNDVIVHAKTHSLAWQQRAIISTRDQLHWLKCDYRSWLKIESDCSNKKWQWCDSNARFDCIRFTSDGMTPDELSISSSLLTRFHWNGWHKANSSVEENSESERKRQRKNNKSYCMTRIFKNDIRIFSRNFLTFSIAIGKLKIEA